jgi:translocation and assembly module TamB
VSDTEAPIPTPAPPAPPVQAQPREASGGGGRSTRPRVGWGLPRLLLGLAFQVLLLVPVLLGLILGTQTGLKTALAMAQDLAPGMIRIGEVEGRVLGRLRLRDLEIRLPDLDLDLGGLDLDWRPWEAIAGTLSIRELRIQDLDLTMTPKEEEPSKPLSLPDVALPLGIEIGEILVERLRVFQRGVDAPVFRLDRAVLAAGLREGQLALRRLELDLPEPRLSARASGEARLQDRYPLGLELNWELALPPAARLAGQGRIGGDLARLIIDHEVSGSARVRLAAEVTEVLEALSWTGEIELQGVEVRDFAADAPALALTGLLETQGDLQAATVSGTLNARAQDLPDFGDLAASLSLRWQDRVLTLDALDLRESVSGARFGATGNLDLGQDPGVFAVQGGWERLRWPLSGDLQVESPQGRLDASGTFAAYAYRLSGAVQGPGFPAVDLGLAGQGDRQGTRIAPLEVKTLDGTLTASADLAWAPALTWDLRLRGEGLNPAGVAPGIEDRLGLDLQSQGGLDRFQYRLAATTQGPGLPPARLALEGTGDRRQTELGSLRLEALNGLAQGKARAGWDPKVTWDAELAWSGIDPGAFAPEWPGRLEGRVQTQGALEPDGPHLDALIDGLGGELRGFPVAASGRLEVAGRSLRVQGLDVSSGPTRLTAEGTVEPEALDLAFDLSSPDLGTLMPEARGSIDAKGRVGGTLEAPRLTLDLTAKDAELQGQGIGSLTGAFDLVLSPAGPFDVRLDGQDLVAGGMRFATLRMRGDGDMPDHRLSLSLTGEPLSARLEATGSLAQDQSYQGTLSRLELDSVPVGAWRLERPMPLKLAGSRMGVGPLCLRNAQGSGGCLGFEQQGPGRWSADIDLDRLGVELVQAFLPPKLTAEGEARIKGRFQAEGPLLTGEAVAEIPTGRLRVSLGRGKGEVLEVSGSRLTLDSGPKGIGGRLDLPLQSLGSVAGDLELPGWRLDQPGRPDQPLRGALRAKVEGLSRVSNLVPDLTGVTGSIDADLALGGTLGSPEVRGQASARGLGAEVPLIGLKLSELTINLLAERERLDLQGQGNLGGGRLELIGEYLLGPGDPGGTVRLVGDRLKVASTKEYFAVVSPSIDLASDAQGLRVRGEVQVPEARIRPRSLPAGTVSASPDMVLMERAGGSEGAGLPLDLDVRLRLGDDVTIDAFGVRGRLAGDLRVFQEPGRPMLGDGQLAIVDGLYRLSGGFGLAAEMGVPLTIEQGRLVFAKSPIDNPGLLLQAQREGGGTTAGVRVLGTLRNPKLAFFSDSDPDMTQADITKYLLTGVPPRRDPGAGDQALSLGTYVQPKLYMEYETGLGDQKDKVKLRYDLTRRIELQTETGDSQGGDIFFKFER